MIVCQVPQATRCAPHTHHTHHGQLDRGVRGNDEVVVDDESGFGVLPSIVGGGGRGD